VVHLSQAAGLAAEKKNNKYTKLALFYSFMPIAFETLGPVKSDGVTFIHEIGHRICNISGDPM